MSVYAQYELWWVQIKCWLGLAGIVALFAAVGAVWFRVWQIRVWVKSVHSMLMMGSVQQTKDTNGHASG